MPELSDEIEDTSSLDVELVAEPILDDLALRDADISSWMDFVEGSFRLVMDFGLKMSDFFELADVWELFADERGGGSEAVDEIEKDDGPDSTSFDELAISCFNFS